MGKVALIARIILGLIFLVFGRNGFFQFLEMPPMSEEADAYLGALAATGVAAALALMPEALHAWGHRGDNAAAAPSPSASSSAAASASG